MEIWKDIDGYEGIYQISNIGRVKSLDRMDESGRRRVGKILSPRTRKIGYCDVGLRKNGKVKLHYIHRLVCKAFVENPKELTEVNHKDEDKSNNVADNLEWCTRSYNLSYGKGAKQRTESIMSKPGWLENQRCLAKIDRKNAKRITQYDTDGNIIATYKSIYEAHRATGINHVAIRACCKGKTSSSGGYKWKIDTLPHATSG